MNRVALLIGGGFGPPWGLRLGEAAFLEHDDCGEFRSLCFLQDLQGEVLLRALRHLTKAPEDQFQKLRVCDIRQVLIDRLCVARREGFGAPSP